MAVNESLAQVNVFMVEDDKFYCEYVKRLLASRKQPQFDVQWASDMAEAMRYLKEVTPDVVLLDLNLPDSRGLESLSRVRESADGCPIIILTGSDNEQLGLQSVSLGAHDYLVKQQVGNESLVRSIRYAIQRRRYEEQSQRMAAIQDFVATLAHDMNVPLIGTENLLDGLISGHLGGLNAGQAEALNVMKAANKSQLQLVQRLLEIYHYEAGRDLSLCLLNVKELLVDCVNQFSENSKSQSQIQSSFAALPSGCCILGEEEALRAMLVNLLDNAVNYGDSGSLIDVSAELADSKLCLRVHNFGKPMPEEVKSSMLSKFWQGVPGKTYVAKTGLGLYLCHRIAQLHHGRITCESTLEDGTTITVKLPVSA
ncbi:hybrid sensor histidine kinase/response regulator [bacterium]|nr:hybrid sensor histidine kinase/response regulator [bacterium]MBP9810819.1 hybrid sensor histidine kinase/response regulator [bacterium]